MNRDRLRRLAREVLPDWARELLAFSIRKRRALLPRYAFSFSNAPEDSPESPFPFLVSSGNALEELGARYRPTKRRHNYLPYYWMHFRDIRFVVKSVLEAAALQLARSEYQVSAQPETPRQLRQSLASYQIGPQTAQIPLTGRWKPIIQRRSDDKVEQCVAQELQPLVVLRGGAAVA